MTRRKAPRRDDPVSLAFDAWALGWEASMVIGLRMAKLAGGGPAASSEAQLMVSEKIGAAIELASAAALGTLGTTFAAVQQKSVSHYLRAVRANRRRLTG